MGWDLTLTMAKSESLLLAFGTEAERRAVLSAHEAGVLAVHRELQRLTRTRVGQGGTEVVAASTPVAAFIHYDSREHDPNGHTHLVIPNAGVRRDGASSASPTGTITSDQYYFCKMYLGQLYRNVKANELQKRCGVELDIDVRTGTYELKGVSKEVLAWFSTRRQQINKHLGSRSASAKASQAASLATRRAKAHLAGDALSRHWLEKARQIKFSPESVSKMFGRKKLREPSVGRAERIVNAAINRAIGTITEERSHFSERDLTRKALALTLGNGVDPSLVLTGIRRVLADRKRVVELGVHKKEAHYSTPQILEEERRSLQAAKVLGERTSRTVPKRSLDDALRRNPKLNPGQREAVRTALKGPDLTILAGLAGVGKTTVQRTIIEALQGSRERVICIAPTNKALEEMREKAQGLGATEFYTIDRLVYGLKHNALDSLGHHARMLVREAFRQGTWKAQRITLGNNTTVLVDEASMADNPRLGFIAEEAARRGARMIVSGDENQLPSIGRGGMLSELRARAKTGQKSFLSEVIRQREEWARKAVKAMGTGVNAQQVVDAFDKHDLVTVSETRAGAIRDLIRTWAKKGVKDPQRHQIYAATNEECDTLNGLAQAQLRASGGLGRLWLGVGRARFHSGDRIVFTTTRKNLGVHASAFATIKWVDPISRRITVTLDQAVKHNAKMTKEITFSSYNFRSFKHSYAVTAHRGQGMTINEGDAYILAGGQMESREMAYVKLSRAQYDTHIFVDKNEAGPELTRLASQFNQSRAKFMAHSILRENGRPDGGLAVMGEGGSPRVDGATHEDATRSVGH